MAPHGGGNSSRRREDDGGGGPKPSEQDRHGDAAGRRRQGSEAPLSEWIVGLLGLVLVAGSVGFLGYEAIWGDSSPPAVSVSSGEIMAHGEGYLVEIRAVNEGGSTAAGLVVEGELRSDDGSTETSETTFDYLPPHSERQGGLFFTKDPRRFELELRALGYQEP